MSTTAEALWIIDAHLELQRQGPNKKNLGAFLPPNQKLDMNFNKGLILKPFSLDRGGKLTTFLEWWQEGASRRLSHIYQSTPGGKTSVIVPYLTWEGCRVNDQMVAWKGMNTAE